MHILIRQAHYTQFVTGTSHKKLDRNFGMATPTSSAHITGTSSNKLPIPGNARAGDARTSYEG
jgi:hypothetical protein